MVIQFKMKLAYLKIMKKKIEKKIENIYSEYKILSKIYQKSKLNSNIPLN